VLHNFKRVVVKVGSSIITDGEQLSLERIKKLSSFINALRQNHEVVLVSSGAVAAGFSKLNIDRNIIENRQALASIGQPLLMKSYKRLFKKYNIIVSQVLVTAMSFNSLKQLKNVKSVINTLLSYDVLPIVNENDTTAIDELIVGDNDQLSASIAIAIDADLLIILSDIDGYYNDNPTKNSMAKIKKIVTHISQDELNMGHTPNSYFATGGIVTKLKAADTMLKSSKSMFLSSGFDLSAIESFIFDNKHESGTLFIND